MLLRVATGVHTGPMKPRLPLAAVVLALATSCSGVAEEAPSPEPDPISAIAEDSSPDPAEEACQVLVDGRELDGVLVRPLALTSDGGVLDEEWQWGVLLLSLGLDARDSADIEVRDAAEALIEYGQGEAPRQDFHGAGMDLLAACQGAGFIDSEWVAIPWPSEQKVQQFLTTVALADESLIAEDVPVFYAALEACQGIADRHNDTGSIPDWDWLSDQLALVADEYGIEFTAAVPIVIGGIGSFCTEYEQIVEDSR